MSKILAKPWYFGKIHEFEKCLRRLIRFDMQETPFMNKYGYNKRFILIFRSGRFNALEIRENSQRVTTHRISGKENA